MTENQENKTVDSSISADEKSVKFGGSILDLVQGADVEWKVLGEVIISLNTGLNPRKFFQLNTPNSKNYYVTIREIHDGKIVFSEKTDKMNDEALRLCNNRSNLEKGDILFSGTGTIGETVVLTETPTNWNIKEGVYTIKPKQDIILSKFLMYLLRSDDIRQAYLKKAAGGTVKSVPMKELKNIKIPIPSLEIQQKVVEILDKMTDYVTELTAELTLRQKQYAYYRDKLLTFPSQSDSDESLGVEWRVLGEICEIKRGKRLVKNELEEVGKYPVYQNSMTPLGYYHQFNFDGDNTFIICAGAAGEIGYMSENFWAADDVSVLTVPSNLMSRYLYHFLLTKQNSIKSKVRRASVPRLSKISFENIKIPVPTLSEQKRIVEILDSFDKLTSNLTDGLPHEIKLRKKQYEYWREQLLSFKRE